jgi:hypothetical protein
MSIVFGRGDLAPTLTISTFLSCLGAKQAVSPPFILISEIYQKSDCGFGFLDSQGIAKKALIWYIIKYGLFPVLIKKT